MNRTSIASWSLLAFSITFLSACSMGSISYKTETLEKLGVKIEKPRQWTSTRTESGDNYVDYIIDVPEGSDDKNGIVGKISINLVKPLEGEAVKIQDEVDGLKKLFASSVTDMKILEEADTKLMNFPAKRVTLQFRNNEDKTTLEKAVFIVTVKSNQAYVLLLDDDVKDFDKNLPVYERIATSMQPL